MTKQELIILTMALGDGCLSGNRLQIVHKALHEEYLDWKIFLLNEVGITNISKTKFINNNFPAFKLYTKRTNDIGKLKKMLYQPNKSYKCIVNNLSDLILSILYMDDGSISSTDKKSVLTISTCTSKEENQMLIDAIKTNFNVSFGQRKMGKYYSLICGTKEARKFMEIVNNYVSKVSCMHYKLKVKNQSFVI